MPDGRILLNNWWNWSIEPLGGGRGFRKDFPLLIELLPQLKQVRADIPKTFTEHDLRLAHDCQLLEDQLLAHKFKMALSTCERVLEIIGQAYVKK